MQINWQILSSKVLKGFFQQLSKYKQTQYYSLPKTIQSSVGLIFRLSKQQIISNQESFDKILQIMLNFCSFKEQVISLTVTLVHNIQFDKVNIVFPGGQCDQKQSDLNACIRELKQEIGINTHDQCVHIGQIPSNFYYLKKRGKQVHISCHVFIMKTTQYEWVPTLNPDELRQFKWVSITDLLDGENYKQRNQVKLGVFDRMPAFAANIAKKQITNVILPELDLKMNRNLWGLTLWIWSYVLQMSIINIQKSIPKEQLKALKSYTNIMKGLQLKFKPYSILKYPANLMASGWHYLYRVRPFQYRKRSSPIFQKLMILSIILMTIMVLLLFWTQTPKIQTVL